jgi:hypothetical protein
VSNATDCNDSAAAIHLGATELCDGVDNDCDGDTDEDDAADASTWYVDSDGDGFGNTGSTTAACSQPSGHVSDDTDCDDSALAIHPAATEVCDGADNDCDGDIDEDDAADVSSWYFDGDGDTYGDPSNSTEACTEPSGFVSDASDCDDFSPAIHPAATEVCDGADNDCDGTIDEDDSTDVSTWYLDGDGDGYGTASSTTGACAEPAGYVSDSSDCNDSCGTCYPGSASFTTSPDGKDQDCDGTVDELDSGGIDRVCPPGTRADNGSGQVRAACESWCGSSEVTTSGCGTGGGCFSNMFNGYSFDTCSGSGGFTSCPNGGYDWSCSITCTCTAILR